MKKNKPVIDGINLSIKSLRKLNHDYKRMRKEDVSPHASIGWNTIIGTVDSCISVLKELKYQENQQHD
jgi:hypothetical protein